MASSANQILALARAGNPVRAWERFGELGLAEATDDIKALTLKGRLLKDLGDRADGEERLRLYGVASQAYRCAYDLKVDSYPLINAATLALLARDEAQACDLARAVLGLIESDPDEGETPYWREATRAEALLLLGETERAKSALGAGIARLPRAWEDHAATIGQFERILAARKADMTWLDAYRPAPAVHFSGLIGLDPEAAGLSEAIEAPIATIAPGFAYGALAAGADILIAEALVKAGALLHVVLPFAREQFRAISVSPYGAEWEARFDALLGQAETVEELWEAGQDAEASLASLVGAANLAAMGQCIRRAEALRSRAHAFAIKAVGEPLRGHLAAWEERGLALHLIEAERVSDASHSAGDGGAAETARVNVAILGRDFGGLAGSGVASDLAMTVEDGAALLCGSLASGLDAAINWHRRDPQAALGAVANPFLTEGDQWGAGVLARRLAQSAAPGQLLADRATAMIAKAISPARRVEEMGEVATLSGPLTVYAITD